MASQHLDLYVSYQECVERLIDCNYSNHTSRHIRKCDLVSAGKYYFPNRNFFKPREQIIFFRKMFC